MTQALRRFTVSYSLKRSARTVSRSQDSKQMSGFSFEAAERCQAEARHSGTNTGEPKRAVQCVLARVDRACSARHRGRRRRLHNACCGWPGLLLIVVGLLMSV